MAQIDSREFVVDKIIDHVGNENYKRTHEFKVRWKGLGEDKDRWLPWKEVRLLSALREYALANNLKRLLPSKDKVPKKKKKK